MKLNDSGTTCVLDFRYFPKVSVKHFFLHVWQIIIRTSIREVRGPDEVSASSSALVGTHACVDGGGRRLGVECV